MPDISMCSGKGCNQKDKCYRHTATPNPYRQAYFGPPMKTPDDCEYFWECISKSEKKRLDVVVTKEKKRG